MANILARFTDGNKYLLEIDADPSTGAGVVAPLGSLAMLKEAVGGGMGTVWLKSGTANTTWFRLNGPQKTLTKTANYSMTISDRIILADTSGGAFNLTLYDPALMNGVLLNIFDSAGTFNTNNLTLVRFGAEKISGLAASRALQANWGIYTVLSNGTDWVLG